MNVAANLLMNPVPPFDNLEVRRAVAMTIDRKAFVDILTAGPGRRRRRHAAAAGGTLGPAARPCCGSCRATIPTSPRAATKARAIMAAHGYGPDKRLKLKLSTRNLPTYRDAAVILISQLKEIYIDAELQIWSRPRNGCPKLIRARLPDRR